MDDLDKVLPGEPEFIDPEVLRKAVREFVGGCQEGKTAWLERYVGVVYSPIPTPVIKKWVRRTNSMGEEFRNVYEGGNSRDGVRFLALLGLSVPGFDNTICPECGRPNCSYVWGRSR